MSFCPAAAQSAFNLAIKWYLCTIGPGLKELHALFVVLTLWRCIHLMLIASCLLEVWHTPLKVLLCLFSIHWLEGL